MASNPNYIKTLYSDEQKLHVLSLQHVSAVEIAGLMEWSPPKAYIQFKKIRANGFDISVPFEPHRYDLDKFLGAFKKDREKVRSDILKSMINRQSERQIEG